MIIQTWADKFHALHSAVVTASSITPPSATTTEPTGDGIFQMATLPQPTNSAAIAFYGGDAADGTFTARITGWRQLGGLWIPVPLLTLSGILGAMTGVSGAGVTNLQAFADTLTIGTAFTSAYEIINPTGDQVAVVKVDAFGCDRIQAQVAKGTCAGIAALAAGF